MNCFRGASDALVLGSVHATKGTIQSLATARRTKASAAPLAVFARMLPNHLLCPLTHDSY
jgi:hypothetical protein